MRAYFAALLAILCGEALAQCQNNVQLGCGVYEACFAKYCPCSGSSNEYFLSYGKKYCESFLGNANFSEEGRKWRDRTLLCLQEAIVPKLDITVRPTCNCASMEKQAYDTHVRCYTAEPSSVCNLPVADLNEIRKTIAIKDLFDKKGWQGMKEVSAICSTKAKSQDARKAWAAMKAVLDLR